MFEYNTEFLSRAADFDRDMNTVYDLGIAIRALLAHEGHASELCEQATLIATYANQAANSFKAYRESAGMGSSRRSSAESWAQDTRNALRRVEECKERLTDAFQKEIDEIPGYDPAGMGVRSLISITGAYVSRWLG